MFCEPLIRYLEDWVTWHTVDKALVREELADFARQVRVAPQKRNGLGSQ